jgi:hypothetical protein
MVMPVLIGVLLISIIGIPLAILAAALWLIALMLCAPLAAFYTGRKIISGTHSALLVLLLGAFVLGIVSLLPILGQLVVLVAVWFGTGSILLNLKRIYKKPKYEV